MSSQESHRSVLLVDPDESHRSMLAVPLREAGLMVVETARMEECLQLVNTTNPGVVVLSASLPDLQETSFSQLKALGLGCPVLLVARGEELSRWSSGAQPGPDDFLQEPYEDSELVSRVHRQLQRSVERPRLVALGGGVVDLGRGVVSTQDKEVSLSPLEQELLRFFFAHPGQAVSREDLLKKVWGYRSGVVTRAVDHTVKRLRSKIEANSRKPVHLLTVHGVGYRYEPGELSLPERMEEEESAATPDLASLSDKDLPLVVGRYRLESVLGRGGMGRVYHATLLGPAGFTKAVAFKVIARDSRRSEAASLDFIQEARLGGLLKHPNVVDVYDFGEVQGQFFIAMELVEGRTLAQFMRHQEDLPGSVLLDIAIQVCDGLAHAHALEVQGERAGLVHRDIKPGNVLLGQEGTVKLMDFGMAKVHTVDTAQDAAIVVGTPAYMSPEQVGGQLLDQRSDLFSLGIVLSHMALGRNVFRADSLPATFHRITQVDEVLKSEKILEEVDAALPGLGRLLTGCLTLNLTDRLPDALTLQKGLRDLAQAMDGPSLRQWLQEEPPPIAVADSGVLSETTPRPQPDSTDTLPIAVAWTSSPLGFSSLGNLPSEVDHFVGRGSDLDALADLVTKSRLITVMGPGGMGKTRLCTEFARRQGGNTDFQGKTWFCDLTDAEDLEDIQGVLIPFLGDIVADDRHSGDWIQVCGERFAEMGPLLLVLDNAEQIVGEVASVLSRWLPMTSETIFLVTSRERLGVQGEASYPLEPLDVKEGIALFVDRARAFHPRFELAPGEIEVAEAIVQRLDGIPLAIELAASRVQVLPPAKLLEALSRRLEVLRSPRREVKERQKTMRQAIAWSWDLLSPWEQACMAQCSVFHGGFSLDAAEEIIDLSDIPDAPWMVFVIETLMEKSLLHATYSPLVPGEVRFDMYGSIRDFVLETLPDSAEHSRRRHAHYWARLGDRKERERYGARGSMDRLNVLQVELENILAALHWGFEAGDSATAAQACQAVGEVLLRFSPQRLQGFTGQVLEMEGVSAEDRVAMLRFKSLIWDRTGAREKALESLREALSLAEQEGLSTSRLLPPLARQLFQLGRHDEAHDAVNKAVTLLQNEGLFHEALTALGSIATLVHTLGREEDARGYMQEMMALQGKTFGEEQDLHDGYAATLELVRSIGHRRSEGEFLMSIGLLHVAEGDYDAAEACMQAGLTIYREMDNRVAFASGTGNLGDVYLARGDLAKARDLLSQGVDLSREACYTLAEGAFLGSLADLARREGDLEAAQETFETAERIVRQAADPIELSKLLTKRGHLELARGDLVSARKLLEEADALCDLLRAGPGSVLRSGTARLAEGLKEAGD